ncbi:MAG TPA: 50S ribosomal protein L18 [Lentisphaeria bacterium]|nr:MAG: 50S ribosomal protein L18 [Lentisphaerae bacterium GWF2_49_21]HBC85521.1 50S ribosomal protein L18 [Lentisphaeria bacterium]
MSTYKTKKEQRMRRHNRLRKILSGTAQKPRLAVNFSSKHIYAQLIDDDSGKTIVSASSLCEEFRKTNAKTNLEGAKQLGKLAADKAVAAGIKSIVFDRGGYKYHGRVKAFADAARSGGLQF